MLPFLTLADGRRVPVPRALLGPRPTQRAIDAQLVACGLTTLDELHADDERRAFELLQGQDRERRRFKHRASAQVGRLA